MLAKIYRIEHSIDGYGPYSVCVGRTAELNFFARDVVDSHATDWHKVIYSDVCAEYAELTRWGSGWHCGFDSLEKLHAWFNGILDELKNAGYLIKVYKLPISSVIYTQSGRQVLFEKPEAADEVLEC